MPESNELRERVARALWQHNEQFGIKRQFQLPGYLPYADAALAALGLDDLDAAVERGAVAYGKAAPGHRNRIRVALEAALTATAESEES